MSKLSILFLGIFAASLCSVKAVSKEEMYMMKKAMLQYFHECNKQFGFSKDDLKVAKEQNNFYALEPCLIGCVFKRAQLIKYNKIQFDTMMKQVDMTFPDEMKEPMKYAVNKCRGVEKDYNDICKASFWTAKCIYDTNPKNFLFE